MKIAGIYSFKGGGEIVEANFALELQQIEEAIATVNSTKHKAKISQEKMMSGKMFFRPDSLNEAFKQEFQARGWHNHKISTEYSTESYTPDYERPHAQGGVFRAIDFVKNRVGVEMQFGKYALSIYSGCAKMTIFHNQDIIDVGVEIVPLKAFADEMSTGVSYFEQFVWDLEHRGVADIDIPVLILGITA